MSEQNVQHSNANTTASTTGFQTNAPKQTLGGGLTSFSSGLTQSSGFFNSIPQVEAGKSTTGSMLMASSGFPNTSTPKTTATGNATLFNIASSTGSNNVTSNFTSGSSTLAASQQFKPPSSQSAQQKPMANVTVPSSNSITLGGINPTTTVQGGISFGNVSKPTSAASTSLNPKASLSTNVTVTSTPLSLPSSTTTLTASLSNKPVTSVAASTPQQQSLTFQQLEELILNKWTAELYEQEKVFLNQATQINIWDKVINENAEKLSQLHSTMEKVRKQQTKINDDLEIIFTHQKDLEACLVPMEKEDLLSVLKADPNRKNLYINAKKIDSQIKSMSEDLKETIEHINETSRSHDTEDPVIQVGRILNAHMESLRWIDEHTARMQDYFDSLLKMHDDLRRECEISKHDIY